MSIKGLCLSGPNRKEKVPLDKYEIGILSNGKYQARGTSSECEGKVYAFLKKEEALKLADGKTIKKWPVDAKKQKEKEERKQRKKERKEKQKEKEKEKKLKEKEKAKKEKVKKEKAKKK